jgi:hypothetical protein
MSNPNANVTNAFVDLASKQPIDDRLYGGNCTTLLGREIRKVSWMSFIAIPMKKEPQGESASYKFSRSADALLHSWATMTTPEVRVKRDQQKTYRIAFTQNLMHNVMKTLTLTFNDLTALGLDPVSLDQLAEHQEEPGKWDAYNKMIGNVPALVEFGSVLPSKELKLPLKPMPWEKDVSNALLLCCLKMNEVKLNGDFQLELSKLIRVQKLADEQDENGGEVWVNCKANSVNYADIIEVKGGKPLQLPLPEMWAEYALVTKPERKFHRDSPHDYLLEQVQRYTHKRERAGTHRFDFKFNYPTRALYMNALNKTGGEYNNHSNYSTNPHDSTQGKDPMQFLSLYYDNIPRFERFPASHFSDIVPYYHNNRVPMSVGYHAHSYSLKNGLEQDCSTNFTSVYTSLEIVTKDTANDDEEDNPRRGCYYCIELRGVNHHIGRIDRDVFGFPSYGQNRE